MKSKILLVTALCVWLWQLVVIDIALPIPTRILITEPVAKDSVLAYEELKPEGFTAFIFTGDIMLGRHVERLSRRYSPDYPFRGLSLSTLASNAAIVGNFEASVPKTHVPTPNYQLRFSVSTSTLPQLREAGFTHLSLANNHTYDFGTAGYQYTYDAILQHTMVPFGNPYIVSTTSTTYLQTPYGSIALVGINQTFGPADPNVIAETLAVATNYSVKQIVFVHWGNEYQLEHARSQKVLSQLLVDNGADIIIGHHPHVVQDIDSIDGVPVLYSLGNYIFDQYFSYDVQVGLVVVLELGQQATTITLHPITSIGTLSQPRLQTEREKEIFLTALSKRSHEALKPQIQSGVIPLLWQFASSSKTAMIGQ